MHLIERGFWRLVYVGDERYGGDKATFEMETPERVWFRKISVDIRFPLGIIDSDDVELWGGGPQGTLEFIRKELTVGNDINRGDCFYGVSSINLTKKECIIINKIIEALSEKKEEYIRDEHHGYKHALDLLGKAKQLVDELGREDEIDWDVLTAAILLHDIDVSEERHGKVNAIFAEKFLGDLELFSDLQINRIKEAIELHDDLTEEARKKRIDAGIEAQILFDVDQWAAFGVMGIYRYLAIYLKRGHGLDVIIEKVLENLKRRCEYLHFPRVLVKLGSQEDYNKSKKFFRGLKEGYEENREGWATMVFNFIKENSDKSPAEIALEALRQLKELEHRKDWQYFVDFFEELKRLVSAIERGDERLVT